MEKHSDWYFACVRTRPACVSHTLTILLKFLLLTKTSQSLVGNADWGSSRLKTLSIEADWSSADSNFENSNTIAAFIISDFLKFGWETQPMKSVRYSNQLHSDPKDRPARDWLSFACWFINIGHIILVFVYLDSWSDLLCLANNVREIKKHSVFNSFAEFLT